MRSNKDLRVRVSAGQNNSGGIGWLANKLTKIAADAEPIKITVWKGDNGGVNGGKTNKEQNSCETA